MDDLRFDPAQREETVPPPRRRRDVFIAPDPLLFINVWMHQPSLNKAWIVRSYHKTPGNIRRASQIAAAMAKFATGVPS